MTVVVETSPFAYTYMLCTQILAGLLLTRKKKDPYQHGAGMVPAQEPKFELFGAFPPKMDLFRIKKIAGFPWESK